MAKNKKNNHILGSAQKDILLRIAENEPMSINRTGDGRNYKTTHTAHSKLQSYGYVRDYANSGEPQRYWLTIEGIKKALLEGADPDKVRSYSKLVHDKQYHEPIASLCEFVRVMGIQDAKITLETVETLKDGFFTVKNLPFPLKNSKIDWMIEYLKKHPEAKKEYVEGQEKILKCLKI